MSSVDSQVKEVEFSCGLTKPDGSGKDTSVSDDDEQEATQAQPRLLRRSARILLPPTRYGQEDDDHVSFVLVTEAWDSCSYREAIEVDDSENWITVMEHEMESLETNQT